MNEDAELDERIEAAKARKKAAETERQAIEERESKRRQAEELEREAANTEALARAEAELGTLNVHFGIVETHMGNIILRKPNHLKFRQFQDANQFSSTQCDNFVRKGADGGKTCVFYPEGEKLDLLFEELPATIIVCANKLSELARGATKEAEAKS
ncbi:MAG TPA: hypothetical protein VLC09_03870 [Polyangiaceae bacterium]|nr:hypothetical protein [Polyangiaceae bacterium]